MKEAPEVSIYFEDPPRHLVCNDHGGVDWTGVATGPTNTKELLDSIKTARNNLFHGDKRQDHGRDNDLMEAGLFILNAAFIVVEQD